MPKGKASTPTPVKSGRAGERRPASGRKAETPRGDSAPAAAENTPWLSSWWAVTLLVAVCVAVRVAAVRAYSLITDCDETFNYWEPTHYMLYGSGQQTWEYSPLYALRSYAYTGLHAAVGALLSPALAHDKLAVFHAIRYALAVTTAVFEAYFLMGVAHRFGARLALWTAACSLTSAGMFHASHAFLPSSFTLTFMLAAWGAWFRGRSASVTCLAALAVALILGWPFAVVALVPMALHMLVHAVAFKYVSVVIAAGLASASAVLIACVAVDRVYYARTLIAPWNIILYNAFNVGGSGQGADLYGVEPPSYYARNLLLNFPGTAMLAAMSPLAFALMYVAPRTLRRMFTQGAAAGAVPTDLPPWSWALATLAQLWLWFAFMSARPHKEERFMFVVYPLIAFAGGVTLEAGVSMLGYSTPGSGHSRRPWGVAFAVLALGVSAAASAARVAALVNGYSAPFEAWTAFAHHVTADRDALGRAYLPSIQHLLAPGTPAALTQHPGLRVCVGKEWYRFPASFFLPDRTRVDAVAAPQRYEHTPGGYASLAYLKSAFTGQLPQPYLRVNGSSAVRTGFNDENKEEMDRYVDVTTCDYVVDLKLPTAREAQDAHFEPYFDQPLLRSDATCTTVCAAPHVTHGVAAVTAWRSVHSTPFLHVDSSPALTRAVYIPGYSEARNAYGEYHVLQRMECTCE